MTFVTDIDEFGTHLCFKKNTTMTKNMSKTDGFIRIVVALVIGVLWYTGTIHGILMTILSIVAIIFIVTGFINFCPLYAVFKIRTRGKS